MSAILSVDEKILLWLNGLVGRVPVFDNLMIVIGDDFFIITCLALSMIALWFGARSLEQRKLNQKTLVATSIAVALTCVWIFIFRISVFLYRPRPSEDHEIIVLTYLHEGSSFPSETAAVAFAFATAVWIGNRKVGIVIGILAILWCFARIYCGTHYPLDIVAGALIGMLTAFFVSKLLQIIRAVPNSIIRFFERLFLA